MQSRAAKPALIVLEPNTSTTSLPYTHTYLLPTNPSPFFKQISSMPIPINPSIPSTPPHNPPPLPLATHPTTRSSNNSPVILALRTNPDVLRRQFEDVEGDGAAV